MIFLPKIVPNSPLSTTKPRVGETFGHRGVVDPDDGGKAEAAVGWVEDATVAGLYPFEPACFFGFSPMAYGYPLTSLTVYPRSAT